MKTWYCAIVCVRTRTDGAGQHIDTALFPFGVSAETYFEAVGKAHAAMEAVKAQRPGWAMWFVQVNNSAGGGLITDPNCISLT